MLCGVAKQTNKQSLVVGGESKERVTALGGEGFEVMESFEDYGNDVSRYE